MEVYALHSDFTNLVKEKISSIAKANELLGFDIRNILYKNKTLSKDKAAIIKERLNIEITLDLIEIKKELNLKRYALPRPVEFPEFSSQLAEFVGIILGDGNIHGNAIRIILSVLEEGYRDYVCNLFKGLFSLDFNLYYSEPCNTVFLIKNSKILKEFLLQIGLVSGNKVKNQVAVPPWILQNAEFSKSCLRGLIDTDGCMHYNKRDKQLRIVFRNNSIPLLNGVSQIGQLLDLPFVKAGYNQVGIYRKKHIERYLNEIGTSNSKHKVKCGAVV